MMQTKDIIGLIEACARQKFKRMVAEEKRRHSDENEPEAADRS